MRRHFPKLPRGVRRLLRLPPTRERLIRDDETEVRLHLDLRADELRALGMSKEEAHAEALRRFGDRGEFRDHSDRRAAKNARRAGLRESLRAWWQDVRFADRQFRRAPAFTSLAVLTLALGIGANAAIFSVVHRLLLEPLPYPDGNRIVMLGVKQGGREAPPNMAVLRAIAGRARSVENVAAVSVEAVAVQEDDGQDTVYALITPNYLKMLAVPPILGRTLTPAEERGEGAPVAMISYSRWQREFRGRANAVGSTVDINYDRGADTERRRYTIVGVTPPSMGLPMSPASFNHNLHEAKPGVWLPLGLSQWSNDAEPRSYARLRPGVSVGQATRELQNIIDSSPELGGKRPTITLTRAQDMLDPGETRMIEVLFAAVGVLLLIACANVANLLMSRAWVRRREFAVRAALGAEPAVVARLVVGSGLRLAVAGVAIGVVASFGATRVLSGMLFEVSAVDPVTFGGIAVVVSVVALLASYLPARRAVRLDPVDALRAD